MPDKKIEDALKELALRCLGQHLFELRLAAPNSTCCLCGMCSQARAAFELATGAWPTLAEEKEAIKLVK